MPGRESAVPGRLAAVPGRSGDRGARDAERARVAVEGRDECPSGQARATARWSAARRRAAAGGLGEPGGEPAFARLEGPRALHIRPLA